MFRERRDEWPGASCLPEVEDFIRWTGGGSGRNVPVVQVEWKVNKGKKRERRLKYWVHFR